MNAIFLSVRVLHVLFGGIWLGSAVFLVYLLIPALRATGPDAAKLMPVLVRRVPSFFAIVSGLNVLSGLWLYWLFTNGFDRALSATVGGRVFGVGGLLGLVAAIMGGSVVGRNMKRSVEIQLQLEKAEPSARAALADQMARHRQKAGTGGQIVAVLLIVTIMLMALGHYV